MTEITIYKSDRCGACEAVIPIIRKLAQGKAKVKVVDVEKCGEKCDFVRYTPLIKVGEREIHGLEELKRVLESG